MKKNQKTKSPAKTIVSGTAVAQKETPIWYYLAGLTILWGIFHYKILFGLAGLCEDVINFEFPNRLFARNNLLNFQFPHWDPNTFGGMPFFASTHTAVLYPTNILLTFLNSDNRFFWYFMQIAILSHFLIAGFCMFFYGIHANMSRVTALFAAIGYMFCGFLVTHTIHPMMVYIFAWLPLVALFMERGFVETEKKIQYFLLAGFVLGLSSLAGHPQLTFYEFIFLGFYGVYLWVVQPDTRFRNAIGLFLFFLLAGSVALVLYLPAAELSNNTIRSAWTFDQISEGSFRFVQFLSFLMPKVFGAWTGDRSTIPIFWLDGPHFGYFTYWETCFYFGIAILFLAFFQFAFLKKDRFLIFCLIWMVFSICIALGSNFFVFKMLYDYLPGFDKFRIPSRILFTWNFLIPLLAARTLDQMRDATYVRQSVRFFTITAIAGMAIAAAVGLGVLQVFFPGPLSNAANALYAATQGWIALFNIGLFLAVILLLARKSIRYRMAQFLLLGALIVDIFLFGMNHHLTSPNAGPEMYGQNRELISAFKAELSREMFRINSRQFTLDNSNPIAWWTPLRIVERNQGMIDNIQLLEGYNPYNLFRRVPPSQGEVQFQRMLDLLNVKYFIDPSVSALTRSSIMINPSRLPRAQMFYRYEIFADDSTVKAYMLNNNFDYKRTLLLTSAPKISLTQGKDSILNEVRLEEYSANTFRLNVKTAENGLLWVSEIWYPAWRASVDGEPVTIHCADYSFRAVEIPRGSHTVVFSYQSKAFSIGATITAIALVLSIAYLVMTMRRNNKTRS